jgi:hypothetical protein
MYDLRRALQDAVFEAPQERQLELMRSYPDLGRFMRPEEVSTLSASDGADSPYEMPYPGPRATPAPGSDGASPSRFSDA